MAETWRALLGTGGAVVIAVSAAYYFLDVLRGGTRPQRTSWLIWSLTGALGFATSRAGGAGPGAYAAAVDATACVLTFLVCLSPRFGKDGGRRADLALDTVAVGGVVLWQSGLLTSTAAALTAVTVNAVGLWPTLRDSWAQPHTESLRSWGGDVVGNAACLAAVAEPSAAALAFPGFLTVAATAVSGVLVVRRGRDRDAAVDLVDYGNVGTPSCSLASTAGAAT